MTQTIKYFTLALETITLYQGQLVKFLQKTSNAHLLEFKKAFEHQLGKIKNVEILKSIVQDKISDTLFDMNEFLERSIRIKKTSQSERYTYRSNLASKQTDRMRLTGQFGREIKQQRHQERNQIDDIIHSYKILEEPIPKNKNSWKVSFGQMYKNPYTKDKEKNDSTNNNIELLNMAIPQMQNRIRFLSVHRSKSPKGNFVERQKQLYRTLESRSHNFRRQIARLL